MRVEARGLGRAVAILGLVVCGVSEGSASQAVPPMAEAGGQVVTCLRHWGEARYAPYGYDHVVHLVSGCEAEVRCDVATDVDPSVISVSVAATEHVEVVTRRRSPARRFEPRVVCYAFED